MSNSLIAIARHPVRVAVVFAIAILALTAALMSTSAVHDEQLLELDTQAGDVGLCTADPGTGLCGNGDVDDDAAAGTDWANLCDATMTKIAPANGSPTPGQHTCVADFATPDGTYYDSEKDIFDITEWDCKSINHPLPKNEIFNAYAAIFTDTSGGDAGNNVLYFGFERKTNNGNSFMGFWLTQSDVGCSHPAGTNGTTEFTGEHVNGDLLVLSNFTGGGRVSTVDAFYWCPSGTDDPFNAGNCTPGATDPLQFLGSGGDCAEVPLAGTDDICGVVNQNCLITPWPPADEVSCTTGGKGQAAPVLDSNQFFEAGIDLTAVGFGGEDLPCFSTFIAETRSSQEVTATTKDYALGEFEVCGKVTIEKQTDPDGAPGTFTYTSDIGSAEDCDLGFSLEDDGAQECTDVIPDVYYVTEDDPTTLTPPFDLFDIQCTVDVNGATSYSIGTGTGAAFSDNGSAEFDAGDDTVQITIGMLGEVTCTFYNRQRATIFIEKVDEDDNPLAGACFTIDPDPRDLDGTATVCDDNFAAADLTDADSDDGKICVENVVFGAGQLFDVSETTVPDGYEGADPQSITVNDTTTCAEREAGDAALRLTFVNKLGTILIHKVSTKGADAFVGGACFTIDPDPRDGVGTAIVCDNNFDGVEGAGTPDLTDTDNTAGKVCVEDVLLNDEGDLNDDYDITETTVPDFYAGDTDIESVRVLNSDSCGDKAGTPDATFQNVPLADIQVNFRDAGSGETMLEVPISCNNTTGTSSTATATSWDDTLTIEDIEIDPSPQTIVCTIVIDP